MRTFISCYFLTFLVFPIIVLFSTSLGTFYDTFWFKATTPVALCTYQLSFSLCAGRSNEIWPNRVIEGNRPALRSGASGHWKLGDSYLYKVAI